MKKENLDIYDLVWEVRSIARTMDCIPNGCVVGDLMIDAISFYRMNDGETKLWHISRFGTWVPDDEDAFGENLYRVSKENDLYTIEKLK